MCDYPSMKKQPFLPYRIGKRVSNENHLSFHSITFPLLSFKHHSQQDWWFYSNGRYWAYVASFHMFNSSSFSSSLLACNRDIGYSLIESFDRLFLSVRILWIWLASLSFSSLTIHRHIPKRAFFLPVPWSNLNRTHRRVFFFDLQLIQRLVKKRNLLLLFSFIVLSSTSTSAIFFILNPNIACESHRSSSIPFDNEYLIDSRGTKFHPLGSLIDCAFHSTLTFHSAQPFPAHLLLDTLVSNERSI